MQAATLSLQPVEVIMPMSFLRNDRNRLAFCFGRQTASRSTNECVTQLQDQIATLQNQLATERAQHKFVMARMEEEAALLARRLAAAKRQLARRDMYDALAAAPSPSAMTH
jgi:hypothetical protein